MEEREWGLFVGLMLQWGEHACSSLWHCRHKSSNSGSSTLVVASLGRVACAFKHPGHWELCLGADRVLDTVVSSSSEDITIIEGLEELLGVMVCVGWRYGGMIGAGEEQLGLVTLQLPWTFEWSVQLPSTLSSYCMCSQ